MSVRSRSRWSLANSDHLLSVLDHTIYPSPLGDTLPTFDAGWHRVDPPLAHYLIPPPAVCYRGPSLLPNGGNGTFIFDRDTDFRAGDVVGEYWGPSTRRGDGIDPIYLTQNAPVPPNARANGAYLLLHGRYLVDCHPHCAMSYLNDPFTLGNSFLQPDPSDPCRVLIVLRVSLKRGQLHELYVNYGKPYWQTFAVNLDPEARIRCYDFYQFYTTWPDI